LKKANGDWNVIYKELKEFMASSVQEKPVQILNGSVSLVKGSSFKGNSFG